MKKCPKCGKEGSPESDGFHVDLWCLACDIIIQYENSEYGELDFE